MRLGYACLNVTLGTRMRTCRLSNATPEHVLELARANLASVREMAEWNAKHGIRMLRISSDLVPFAGRADVKSAWRARLMPDFMETGKALKRFDQRVSAHPGQFTVLSSPRAEVVTNAMRDLDAQATFFDLMGLPKSDLVVHLGGAYGDKDAALARFAAAVTRLSAAAQEKLVIENDDVTWNVADALRAHELTRLPVVFDVLHDRLLPSPGLAPRDALRRALATWPADRTPKVHYSDAAPDGRRGQHGERVDPAAFVQWVRDAHGLDDFDVMIEAKGKEQAVLPLLDALDARLSLGL